MNKIRVGVLRGGPSNEYEVSLESGKAVLAHMPDTYHAVDILVDKTGTWHSGGVPRSLAQISEHIDVAFNALHGAYGEDGGVQKHLEYIGMPYTGSGVFASALAMHKGLAKDTYLQHNIKTPYHVVFDTAVHTEKDIHDIFRSVPMPVFVKPANGGSSVGIRKAHTYDELVKAIIAASEESDHVLIESAVRGREATCGVIDDFRGEKYYALMPVEIVPPNEEEFFTYDAKYTGKSQEICPGRFTRQETEALQSLAVQAHQALGARHYSRSDFIVSPHGIFILETNTLPGLTPESLLPKSLEAVGASLGEFIDHVITQALRKDDN